jgi:hypothetical protein
LGPQPVWLQANSIIDSIVKPLFTAQVAFCRLDRNVAQQKLNLLQFTASLMAQAGACASVMPHAALCAAMPNAGSCRITETELPRLSLNLDSRAA